MKRYDVIIIGFGPTGGTLANLLALHGFSIIKIEKPCNANRLAKVPPVGPKPIITTS